MKTETTADRHAAAAASFYHVNRMFICLNSLKTMAFFIFCLHDQIVLSGLHMTTKISSMICATWLHESCWKVGYGSRNKQAKKNTDRIGLTFFLMMAETWGDSKLICCDIEAAADWRWVKILTASSQDAASQPTSQQPDWICRQPSAASQPFVQPSALPPVLVLC